MTEYRWSCLRRRTAGACLLWISCLFSTFPGLAQSFLSSADIELTTGGGQQILSRRVPLDPIMGLESPQLKWVVGFSTDESGFVPRVRDLFTGTLLDASGRLNLPLFTFDAKGIVVLPRVLGAISLDPSLARVSPVTWPSDWTRRGSVSAFEIRVPIPDRLDWTRLTVAGTLYDNRDDQFSQGWISALEVVPEPSWISGMGVFGLLVIQRFRSHETKDFSNRRRGSNGYGVGAGVGDGLGAN